MAVSHRALRMPGPEGSRGRFLVNLGLEQGRNDPNLLNSSQ